MIAKVAVTVDDTWQRLGNCSKIGVVFVISVITGEVIDYVVKSLVCHECVYHQRENPYCTYALSQKLTIAYRRGGVVSLKAYVRLFIIFHITFIHSH